MGRVGAGEGTPEFDTGAVQHHATDVNFKDLKCVLDVNSISTTTATPKTVTDSKNLSSSYQSSFQL